MLGANGDFASLNLFAYCGNNPVARVDKHGTLWNVAVGAVVGGAIGLITSIGSMIIEKDYSLDGLKKVAVSTISGTVEGGLVALFPTWAPVISGGVNALTTVINGNISGDSATEIAVDAVWAGAIGVVGGFGGSKFKKGGKLINDAVGAFGNTIKKGVNPVVKKAARSLVRKAWKYIGRSFGSGIVDGFVNYGLNKLGGEYTKGLIKSYSSK